MIRIFQLPKKTHSVGEPEVSTTLPQQAPLQGRRSGVLKDAFSARQDGLRILPRRSDDTSAWRSPAADSEAELSRFIEML